ncbi:MAG: hypothetical protein N2376_03745 [Clostridia bacterium]|nr:hypothetical protein [Clostridia bacterium]
MKKVLALLLALMLAGSVSACGRMQNREDAKTGATQKESTSEVSEPTPDASDETDQDNKENLAVPTERLKAFLESKDEQNEILFSTKKDIDGDGRYEIVAGAGTKGEDDLSTYYSSVYVLREKGDSLELFGDNLASGGYGIYEVQLVKLQDSKSDYIYLGLTNGGPLTGFQLLELKDDSLNPIAYSASATGSGHDYLIDENSDGSFDGYIQDRSSYDVLYIPTIRSFAWENGSFVAKNTSVSLPEYPDVVQDVILQYLTLRAIADGMSKEITPRLSELLLSDPTTELPVDVWYTAVSNTLIGIDSQIEFKTQESANQATSQLSYKDGSGKTYAFTFKLVKSEGKWHIDTFF